MIKIEDRNTDEVFSSSSTFSIYVFIEKLTLALSDVELLNLMWCMLTTLFDATRVVDSIIIVMR